MNADRNIQDLSLMRSFELHAPTIIVFLVLLALSLLAKSSAVVNPLPSVNSWYSTSSAGGSANAINLYLSHQRYGQIALYWLLDLFGYRTLAVATSSNAISLALGAFSAIVALRFVRNDAPVVAMLAAGAIFCLHPTMAEILTFSDVTLDVYVSMTCGILAIFLAKYNTSWLGFVSSVLLLSFAFSVYQITLNIAVVLVCINLAHAISMQAALGTAIRPIIAIAIACAFR